MSANAVATHKIQTSSPARRIIMGIIFLALALITWLAFIRSSDPSQVAVFNLVPGGSTQVIAPWNVSVLPALNVIAVICAVLGGYQLARGFKNWTNWALAVVVGLFIFAFLVWAAAGKSLNLAGLIATTLLKSVPITLGALSGILCERAGVTNIAIEGMMLSGAMLSALVASLTHSLFVGLLAGIFIGAMMALLHGWLSIKYKTNQIISATVINILATGLTSYVSANFMQTYTELNSSGIFSPIAIPLLSDIPVLGPILFNVNIFVYAMYFFLILLHVAYFHT